MRYPGCVNGKCNLPWECICDAGWHGKKCDKEGNAPTTEAYEGSTYPPGHGLHGVHPNDRSRNGLHPLIGKRDTDETEAIRRVTQALASADYDVDDKDVNLKRSVQPVQTITDIRRDPGTTDMGIPVRPEDITTPAEMQ